MTAKETDFNAIAHSGKALRIYVRTTGEMLSRIGTRLHHTACMAVFHAAEYGDPAYLNQMFTFLKVNDQTALKRWLADNFIFTNDEGEEANWLSFTNRKGKDDKPIGFYVVKETEPFRKGTYDLEKLFAMESFQNVDVSKPKVYDLNALIEALVKAIDTTDKRAEKNDVVLPDGLATILTNTKRDLAKYIVANDDASPKSEGQKMIGQA